MVEVIWQVARGSKFRVHLAQAVEVRLARHVAGLGMHLPCVGAVWWASSMLGECIALHDGEPVPWGRACNGAAVVLEVSQAVRASSMLGK